MDTSMYVFDKNYMKKEMKNIKTEIHDNYFYKKIQELYDKKINITDDSNLQNVINQIDEHYPVGSYEKFF